MAYYIDMVQSKILTENGTDTPRDGFRFIYYNTVKSMFVYKDQEGNEEPLSNMIGDTYRNALMIYAENIFETIEERDQYFIDNPQLLYNGLMCAIRSPKLKLFLRKDDMWLDTTVILKGNTGDSAYDIWLKLGNVGTEKDFIEFLKYGQDGDSAYQIWLDSGNVGTVEDFLNSLKGKDAPIISDIIFIEKNIDGSIKYKFVFSDGTEEIINLTIPTEDNYIDIHGRAIGVRSEITGYKGLLLAQLLDNTGFKRPMGYNSIMLDEYKTQPLSDINHEHKECEFQARVVDMDMLFYSFRIKPADGILPEYIDLTVQITKYNGEQSFLPVLRTRLYKNDFVAQGEGIYEHKMKNQLLLDNGTWMKVKFENVNLLGTFGVNNPIIKGDPEHKYFFPYLTIKTFMVNRKPLSFEPYKFINEKSFGDDLNIYEGEVISSDTRISSNIFTVDNNTTTFTIHDAYNTWDKNPCEVNIGDITYILDKKEKRYDFVKMPNGEWKLYEL